jgi:hypothetical protein
MMGIGTTEDTREIGLRNRVVNGVFGFGKEYLFFSDFF